MSDALETLPLVDLPRAKAIALIRKWNTHGYPVDANDGARTQAREVCARELLEAITVEPVMSKEQAE